MRRVILVPGISFKFNDTREIFNPCYRAIEQTFNNDFNPKTPDGQPDRPTIYELLTSEATRAKVKGLEALKTLPLYKPEHIYAFDYSPDFLPGSVDASRDGDNEACASYRKPGTTQRVRGEATPINNNTYREEDTRLRLTNTLAEEPAARPGIWERLRTPESGFTPGGAIRPGATARFGLQFEAWRKACPACHFDIIAHSLGGAVAASWLASLATPEQLRHVHSLVTIDSPVNGATALPDLTTAVAAMFKNEFETASGFAGEDLEDEAFVSVMREAPSRVTMTCVSNIYDALISPHLATIRTSNDFTPLDHTGLMKRVKAEGIARVQATLFAGPCRNLPDIYSQENAFNYFVWDDKLTAAAEAAHTRPLVHNGVLIIVAKQLAELPPKWQAANNAFNAERILPAPTLAAPEEQVALEVQLRNTGAHTWEKGRVTLKRQSQDNVLKLAGGYNLTGAVRPGEEVTVRIELTAPKTPATYTSDWSLAYGTTAFGPAIRLELTVSAPSSGVGPLPGPGDLPGIPKPRNPLDDLQAMWEKLIADVQRQLEEFARRMVEEAIRETLRQLCGVVPAIVVVSSGAALWRMNPGRRGARHRSERRRRNG